MHRRAPIWPSVSVIIPTHGQDSLLREKINNTLGLDYPEEKREIIIASDGPNENTAQIVRSFGDRAVVLVQLPERRGKHYAQMVARDRSRGEILVFTDVSVQLEPGALKAMVSNFEDKNVGCVSSEDHVVRQGADGKGETSYVGFEMWLRRLESGLGSLVSVSGSFFAARREICERWHPEQSSDFFVVLHTVDAGLRAVVDPQCRGIYGLTSQDKAEFRRKVRTIVHGLDVFFSHLKLANPLRYALFSWQLISHKLFRWLAPIAVCGLLVSNLFLWNAGVFYRGTLLLQGALYASGLAGLAAQRLRRFGPFRLAGFFVLGNAATMVAWLKFFAGEKFVTWEPTRR